MQKKSNLSGSSTYRHKYHMTKNHGILIYELINNKVISLLIIHTPYSINKKAII